MKKTLLTSVLMTIVLTTFAQLPLTFGFGLKGGINASVITNSDMSTGSIILKNDPKTGFQFGAFAHLGIKKFYLQPELFFVKKNGSVQFAYSGSNYYQNLTINSVQIPVLLGMKVFNFNVASLRVFTGPAISIAMSNSYVSTAKSNIVSTAINNNNVPTLNTVTSNQQYPMFIGLIRDGVVQTTISETQTNGNLPAAIIVPTDDPFSIKNNIWDWHLGLGIDIGPLTIDVRKEWGITNVSDGTITSSNVGFSYKANYLTFCIGFKFN